MLGFMRSQKRYYGGYKLLEKDNKKCVIKGKDVVYDNPVLISKNGIHYISTYFVGKQYNYGIQRVKDEYWRFLKISNPNLSELSVIDLKFYDNDKNSVFINDKKIALENPWSYEFGFDPYLSLREFSKLMNFRFIYRDIDKSVLIYKN
jgi:hypothetical protein